LNVFGYISNNWRLHRSPDALRVAIDDVMLQHYTAEHPSRLRFFDKFRLVT
jgi:hypothetical protein